MDKITQKESSQCINYFKNENIEDRNAEFTRLWTEIINNKENSGMISFQSNSIAESRIS